MFFIKSPMFLSARAERNQRHAQEGDFVCPLLRTTPHRPNASPQAAQRSLRLLSQRKRPFPLGEDEQRRGADVRRTGGRSGPEFVRTCLRAPLLEVSPGGAKLGGVSVGTFRAERGNSQGCGTEPPRRAEGASGGTGSPGRRGCRTATHFPQEMPAPRPPRLQGSPHDGTSCGERRHGGANESSRLREDERYAAHADVVTLRLFATRF